MSEEDNKNFNPCKTDITVYNVREIITLAMNDSERLPKTELRRLNETYSYDVHINGNTASVQLPDISHDTRIKLKMALDNIFTKRAAMDVDSAMKIINEHIQQAEESEKSVPITTRLASLGTMVRTKVLGMFL